MHNLPNALQVQPYYNLGFEPTQAIKLRQRELIKQLYIFHSERLIEEGRVGKDGTSLGALTSPSHLPNIGDLAEPQSKWIARNVPKLGRVLRMREALRPVLPQSLVDEPVVTGNAAVFLSLPQELVTMIKRQVPLASKGRSTWDWHNIMLVSQRWCHETLNDPGMWADIDDGHCPAHISTLTDMRTCVTVRSLRADILHNIEFETFKARVLSQSAKIEVLSVNLGETHLPQLHDLVQALDHLDTVRISVVNNTGDKNAQIPSLRALPGVVEITIVDYQILEFEDLAPILNAWPELRVLCIRCRDLQNVAFETIALTLAMFHSLVRLEWAFSCRAQTTSFDYYDAIIPIPVPNLRYLLLGEMHGKDMNRIFTLFEFKKLLQFEGGIYSVGPSAPTASSGPLASQLSSDSSCISLTLPPSLSPAMRSAEELDCDMSPTQITVQFSSSRGTRYVLHGLQPNNHSKGVSSQAGWHPDTLKDLTVYFENAKVFKLRGTQPKVNQWTEIFICLKLIEKVSVAGPYAENVLTALANRRDLGRTIERLKIWVSASTPRLRIPLGPDASQTRAFSGKLDRYLKTRIHDPPRLLAGQLDSANPTVYLDGETIDSKALNYALFPSPQFIRSENESKQKWRKTWHVWSTAQAQRRGMFLSS
ncbi:hypothetical protein SISSUDRAFT_1116050 [Sistotremastrum suecicum HHB10207 ss-3]|uniref:Uncharacterized protein n=1 Tax=Sistotremastrum suecicum HHB10207 ss-3 TaxID=1314776 RepID=A0A166IGJ2_9AGAM|nr:hypothetical protein SISSUDRAFT_1116050 [Sistotremastrum suecicum HHB10207 ss-3]